MPAFIFFVISFVCMSRMLLMQRAIANIDIYVSREDQRRALLRFYALICKAPSSSVVA